MGSLDLLESVMICKDLLESVRIFDDLPKLIAK